MKQPVATPAVPAFRPYFIRQSLLLSLLFIILNSMMVMRGAEGVQTMDWVRLVISSVVGGCFGATAMWFLRRKKR
ncbi:MAG: hypothetical protein JO171_07440 [Paludibacterium sp.]|uniref:hypothetical protein n=1 Tax=Paludibacterium sp. TaxID=1917523 RepID=UPI0025E9BC71|nr:hypothetical protein [Paludibacterium sp.]MBV8046968.1 hypothetical protein [Paludibacterium sp.]MBV8648100.1 hypothetical protein [Paludibacterium sp.]